MDDNTAIPIAIDQLRIGMYIQLGLNWMSHPFPVSSFRIASESQIEILRGLGLSEVRYVPAKSDPAPSAGTQEKAAAVTLIASCRSLGMSRMTPAPTKGESMISVSIGNVIALPAL